MDKGDFEEWLEKKENQQTIKGIQEHLETYKTYLHNLSRSVPNQELLIALAKAQGAHEAIEALLTDFTEGEFHVS